jgi:hypothetical protein
MELTVRDGLRFHRSDRDAYERLVALLMCLRRRRRRLPRARHGPQPGPGRAARHRGPIHP